MVEGCECWWSWDGSCAYDGDVECDSVDSIMRNDIGASDQLQASPSKSCEGKIL